MSSDQDNPYRPSDQAAEPQRRSERPRIRVRLIPATLLAVFSSLILLACLCAIVAVAYFNVYYRFVDQETELLGHFNQRTLSPPNVAQFAFGLFGGVSGIIAVPAWLRGEWRKSVVLTTAFILFMAISSYLGDA